jgi:hypothetical protein
MLTEKLTGAKDGKITHPNNYAYDIDFECWRVGVCINL